MTADGPLAEGQIHGWKFRLSAQFPEKKADWESKILWGCLGRDATWQSEDSEASCIHK